MTIKEVQPTPHYDVVNDFAELMYGASPGIKKVSAVIAVTDQFDRTTFAHLMSDGKKMTLATAPPPILPGNPARAHTHLMDAFLEMAKTFGLSNTGKIDFMKHDITPEDRESVRSKKLD